MQLPTWVKTFGESSCAYDGELMTIKRRILSLITSLLFSFIQELVNRKNQYDQNI